MVKIRHGLATLNSNNSVVYGQIHKVWVLVFKLERAEHFEIKFEQIFCFAKKKPHRLQQLHAKNAAKASRDSSFEHFSARCRILF